MGQERGLKSEEKFQARSKPKVVSSSCKKVQERDRKGLPRYNNSNGLDCDFRSLNHCDCDLRSLNRSYSSSPHCGIMPLEVSDNEVPKRGSMYQSSKEVSRMKKLREARRKVESYCSDNAFLSFEIVDSLPYPGSKESVLFSHKKHSPLGSMNAALEPPSVDPTDSIKSRSLRFLDLSSCDLPDKHLSSNNSCSASASAKNSSIDELFEICLQNSESKSHSTRAKNELLKGVSLKDQKSDHFQRSDPKSYEKIISEIDSVNSLSKSSAKVGVCNTAKSESGLLNASPKAQFSPHKDISDPIKKPKSLQTSSLLEKEKFGSTANDPANIRRNESFCKSLLNDFSMMAQQMDIDAHLGGQQVLITASSPAHLNGILKLETANGNRLFEFSVKAPKDVLFAKTWKTDNAFNWTYTFHSSNKKINKNGRRTKDQDGQSPPIVGQMQVSCYLCSEMRGKGSLHNSIVMEFVLYDIAQARRSITVEGRSQCPTDSTQPLGSKVNETSVKEEYLDIDNSKDIQNPTRHAICSFQSDASTTYPLSPADLHPQLEIATTVVQIPFNKKETLKSLKKVTLKENQNLSSPPVADQEMEIPCSCLNPATVKVITPSGTHGLPNADEGGPSSLLERWRSGGGCDCGGWDMGCPIAVFDDSHTNDWVDYSTLESHKPMLLFLQGSKEKVPALSIMADGKGQHFVDFHAQLSTLQAFSICIAVLHGFEVASAVIQEKNRQKLHSNSLKLLLEEEVRHLIEAVAIEDKRKMKPPSFFLDPPFSPIGRV